MRNLFYSLILITFSYSITQAQELIQTVRGKIVDEQTEEPIPFVNIQIKDLQPIMGTISDENGYFIIENVPLGRVTLEVSFMGYETLLVTEVLVTSTKSIELNIKLKPSLSTLDEVIIKPKVYKQKAINRTAAVSARMLSVEEASRYAGGFDDPARLASSFAGVASASGGDNAIIVRGNSPKYLQWKIEGIEIPNPNHFANLSSFGGGGLTALSSNLLANSDFITGAFPAEYNNVLAGVFDLRMRNGNSTNFEHSIEAGLIGLDFASEGPISKKNNSSYIANYRYSTLSLLESLMPENAEGTKYQDLSFKLNFPTSNAGTFSLWGIGLIDESGAEPESDISKRKYSENIEKQSVKQFMGSTGLNHKIFLDNNDYLNTTLAITTEGLDMNTQRLNDVELLIPQNSIKSNNYILTFKSIYNRRFSDKVILRSGINIKGLGYNLDFNEVDETNNFTNITDDSGITGLASAFTNFTINHKKFTYNLGLTAQNFFLNNSSTLEPRLGINYEVSNDINLNFSYGMHSRLEPIQIYYFKTPNAINERQNKNLDFTKAHHFVFGYNWDISDKTHLKIEPYYQFLYDVPMTISSNESLLNLQNDWFINEAYYNSGIGRNYGVDATFEHYLDNGFYYLFSASLFNSEFKNKNSETWFNTRFNKNYTFNALAGKEFKVGRSKQHILGVNFRLSIQGGNRHSKINTQESVIQEKAVYDNNEPFSQQTDTSTVLHTSLSYQINRKKVSHKFSIKVLNTTGYKDFLGHRYNYITQEVDKNQEALILPNISYKIFF